MKITVLIENTSEHNSLRSEHGLSLYIEANQHKILFDMGQSDAFAENAEALGIDLSQIDTAIISHGHYDHGGGLMRFVELNQKAPVYINHRSFDSHYNAEKKYIGLDPTLTGCKRFVFADDTLRLDDGLELYSCNNLPRLFPVSGFGLTSMIDGQLVPDDFSHEQYLMITENKKRVLISSCSHKGILNIMNWLKPDYFVGGFHFMRLDDECILKDCAADLMAFPTSYYTCHCTGKKQYAVLKKVMGNKLGYLSTGNVLEI